MTEVRTGLATVSGQLAQTRSGGRLVRRLLFMAVAVAIVSGGLALLALAFSQAAPPPPRNPFAGGMAETAAGGRIGAVIIAMQSAFYRALTQGLQAFSSGGAGLWGLLGVSFAYGVFHAAGPGHGKAVISGYLVANERTLARGAALSFAAAMLQAVVAVALALVLSLVFNATAALVKLSVTVVELVSFALVALLGLALTWRKAGALATLGDPQPADASCGPGCDHAHMPGPEAVDRARDLRAMAGVVLAAGVRPCSGALIVLAFALSQQALAAGVAATFAMAVGTALTTGAIAALAVFAKRLALRLASGGSMSGARAMAALELLAAAFVLVTGLALLAGLQAGAGG
ncbi:nickel/cobalt transporter [Camelimonas lactis]|uniref:Nickel/cobalt efflux system n=1 Tax=Camelimonas lactis TaxID=659006 RepID=A0A4R2GLA2_9HYPH|nr:nickel transporter [Camelimonas lactis]TCO09522.1 ABC-type nickel/cobalt efflux system permease component RcnA [Camelimonas lactis]